MDEDGSSSTCERHIRACIPANYTYLFDTCKFQSMENFAATFRIQEVTNKEKANKWIEDLSLISYVTWRYQVQPPCGTKNAFKSYLKCQHQSSSKPLMNSRISKKTNCNATLILIVRRTIFDRLTRSTDPDPLLMDWPCIVTLSNIHNHKLDSADVLRYRKISPNTRIQLLNMLKRGHSPSSAFHTLEAHLCLENPETCRDGAYLPSVGRIAHFFNSQLKGRYKNKSMQDILEETQKLLVNWEKTSGGSYVIGTSTTNDKHYYVALCSPLMCRVHELVAQSAEMVHLEAVGGLERQRHRVYFLVTATSVGGLPLGVIISNSKVGKILTSAISDLQSVCFPTGSFYFSGSPKVIIADQLRELSILQHNFPSSTILFSTFHLLQDAWCWLSDSSRNKVTEADRRVLYHMFKAVVRCGSEAQLNEKYHELLEHPLCGIYHTFKTYIARHWESRRKWASCYQPDLPIFRYGISKCTDVAFRILRDVLFLKVMAFHLTPLVDFVINQYEKYVEKTLLYAAAQNAKCLFSRFLPSTVDLKAEDIHPHPTVDGVFLVPYTKAEDTITYLVDAADMTCSCLSSCGTKMCEHASAVLQKLIVESTSFYNPDTIIDKNIVVEVAKGGPRSVKSVSLINKIGDNQSNFVSIMLAPADGGDLTPQIESSQISSASPLISDNFTLGPETAASLLQYAIDNGLFGENSSLNLAIEEAEFMDVPSEETMSYDLSAEQTVTYNVPSTEMTSYQAACGDNSATETTCTLVVSTVPSILSHSIENATNIDMTCAALFVTEDTEATIGEATLSDYVSEGVPVDSSLNMPQINEPRSNVPVDTVDISENMPEYFISDGAALTEVVISSHDDFENNDQEDCEMLLNTEDRFDNLIERIKKSQKANPTVFNVAINKMVVNAHFYAKTEEELACAIESFAHPSGLARSKKRRKIRQSRLVDAAGRPL